LSGSYAKGTAVAGGTDLDLFVSLTPSTPGTLKEIYFHLFQAAGQAGLAPRPQDVSIGTSYRGLSVDLVPARMQAGNATYHSLYRRKADSWTQTNVALHISRVANSNRTPEIRVMKIWRNLRRLDIPSFYLELTVIDALYGRPANGVAANVWRALTYLAESFPTARVLDPANTNSIISDSLTVAEKYSVAARARESLAKKDWGEIVW
jgi:hypothetical protein